MYRDSPTEEIMLHDFETLAVGRLEVLKKLESNKLLGLTQEESEERLKKLTVRYGIDDRRADMLSHFVLRLAYCFSENLRRWFLTQECHLFRLRFKAQTNAMVNQFFAANGLTFDVVDAREMARVREHLRNSSWTQQDDSDYYKVPFEEATELIQSRKVWVHQGVAYIPRTDLVTIVVAKFRAALSRQLAVCLKSSQNLKADRRIRPIVNGLQKQYIGTTYVPAAGGVVTRDQLPGLADQSFPLCMENSYRHLLADHHAKHGARMQLGLYLKGIGLSLQDGLLFWKQAFLKKTTPENFDKNYAYNIRHNYGKEGKRVQYSPYGCRKIIMAQPGHQDHCGCPFKNFDETQLKAALYKKRIGKVAVDEIVEKAKGHHYQVGAITRLASLNRFTCQAKAIKHYLTLHSSLLPYLTRWRVKSSLLNLSIVLLV
jgi:DNA primase large subunit